MGRFKVNGVTFTDFGANNYSEEMHLITATSFPTTMVQDVLAGKYPGIYLNPSAPCTDEFFGVFGTPEQYTKFYQRQREAQISKRIFNIIGFDAFEYNLYKNARKEVESNYKDWWE